MTNFSFSEPYHPQEVLHGEVIELRKILTQAPYSTKRWLVRVQLCGLYWSMKSDTIPFLDVAGEVLYEIYPTEDSLKNR